MSQGEMQKLIGLQVVYCDNILAILEALDDSDANGAVPGFEALIHLKIDDIRGRTKELKNIFEQIIP